MKPSLTELALRSRRAMVMGVGGGGDVTQAIPIANYLTVLGLEEIYVGGVTCQWWGDNEGLGVTDKRGSIVLAPTIYDLSQLEHSERLATALARVTAESNVGGRRTAEAVMAELFPWPVFVLGLRDGVRSAVDGLRQFIEQRSVDLFVAVDCGSDTFFTGKEVAPAHTCLIDFMSLATIIQLPVPTVFGLGGYGIDGELLLEDLERNMGAVMRAGGYLGAHGLTQKDAADMELACEKFPDPIEVWVPRAARGDLGTRHIPLNGPWGQIIKITPLAAVVMLFDPTVIVAEVATGARALMHTGSLHEAEDIFQREYDLVPETRWRREVDFLEVRP